ncbi:MAG: hypothetical protein WDW36_001008 [Sanguina aurantia]
MRGMEDVEGGDHRMWDRPAWIKHNWWINLLWAVTMTLMAAATAVSGATAHPDRTWASNKDLTMRALLSGRTVQTSGGSSGKPCSQLLPSAEPRLTHGTPAPGQPARPPAFHTVSGHAAAAAAADAAAASAASTSDRAGVVPPSDATPKPGMLHQGGSPFDGPVTHKGRADGAASQSLPVTDSAGSMTREGWADGTASQPSLLSAVDGEGGGGGGRTLHAMVAVGEDGGGRGSSRAGMRAGRRNRGRTVGHRGADETAQSAVAASEGQDPDPYDDDADASSSGPHLTRPPAHSHTMYESVTDTFRHMLQMFARRGGDAGAGRGGGDGDGGGGRGGRGGMRRRRQGRGGGGNRRGEVVAGEGMGGGGGEAGEAGEALGGPGGGGKRRRRRRARAEDEGSEGGGQAAGSRRGGTVTGGAGQGEQRQRRREKRAAAEDSLYRKRRALSAAVPPNRPDAIPSADGSIPARPLQQVQPADTTNGPSGGSSRLLAQYGESEVGNHAAVHDGGDGLEGQVCGKAILTPSDPATWAPLVSLIATPASVSLGLHTFTYLPGDQQEGGPMRTNTAGKRRRRRRRVRDPELTADDAERAETDDAASAGKESGRQRGTALGGARGGRGGQRRRRHGAGGVGGAVGRKGGVLEGGGGGDETASGGRERDASAVGEGGVLRSRREQAGAAGSASRAEKLAVAKGLKATGGGANLGSGTASQFTDAYAGYERRALRSLRSDTEAPGDAVNSS